MERIEITQSGDRELWLVSREDWTLPIYVDPYESAGEVKRKLMLISPAVSLLKPQFEALLSVIKLHWLSEAHANAWWFDSTVLRSVAEKAPGITPKYYYKWCGKVVEPNPSVPQQADIMEDTTPDAEKFLKFIHHSAAMFSMTQLRLFWRAFYQYGMEWLINQQKPIDLGFCVIQPMPFRQNWKEVMLAKHPADSQLFTKPEKEMMDGIRISGFEADLFSTDLIALDARHHFVYWKLELVHRKPWYEAVRAAEKIRRDAKGPSAYARYYIRQVKSRLSAIVDTYRSFIKEVSRPCGDVVEDGVTGTQRIAPYYPKGKVVAAPPAIGPTAIMVSTKENLLTGPSTTKALENAVQDVWKMPHLLLPENVRDSGDDLE